DLLIGSCASLVLLSPLMMSGGNWYSLAGVLAFGVTCSIVMFIYLTTALGFFGQSLGMRLFSIEVLDIEEEDYPTLHQAAVNSSVYLVSLAFGGVGLIPALFNDEKRAAHDLLSGTIVVREEF
ncbi:MAG TPA: RDD family protein, partial [Pyrinomonadaceae bacterium]|nr:RDD family protein [Pyrinomonadaceae bacterium]